MLCSAPDLIGGEGGLDGQEGRGLRGDFFLEISWPARTSSPPVLNRTANFAPAAILLPTPSPTPTPSSTPTPSLPQRSPSDNAFAKPGGGCLQCFWSAMPPPPRGRGTPCGEEARFRRNLLSPPNIMKMP